MGRYVTYKRTTSQILKDAEESLKTAEFGFSLLTEGPPNLKLCGLRNLVIFGRVVTFVLQNLRSTERKFDEWYINFQEEMKSDPLLLFFKELRNTLEKEGALKLHVKIHIKHFTFLQDLARFGPPPPYAKSFFMGDQLGGSGWEIQLPDGSVSKYYVELPIDIGSVSLHFPETPISHLGEKIEDSSIESLSNAYLQYLRDLLKEARKFFGP